MVCQDTCRAVCRLKDELETFSDMFEDGLSSLRLELNDLDENNDSLAETIDENNETLKNMNAEQKMSFTDFSNRLDKQDAAIKDIQQSMRLLQEQMNKLCS